MWFLEHETLFGGKRVWLRPGTQQMFGRTSGRTPNDQSANGKNIAIDQKTVSRQHMLIKVSEVPPEDGTKLLSRSQVEITDLSCRQGTTIDGQRTLTSKKAEGSISHYDKIVLPGIEHTVSLTLSYPAFKIKWEPVVFTYATKDIKKSRTAHLHSLDIKTSTEFMYDSTTHVVSQKRNLPKVLEGLVATRHIVTSDFLDVIVERAMPQNTNPDNYKASMLEEDFDAAWPREKEYIPPVGAEPVSRPEQMLEPDSDRAELFSGLTFVFLNENQHISLRGPIAAGRGKTLLFPVDFGKTTVDEYVEYAMNAAGEKKKPKAMSGRLPVITIRPSGYPGEMEEWTTEFIMGVDQALNQRSIQQNEFLDAILVKDTSSLQRPPTEIQVASSAPPTIQQEKSVRESTQVSRSIEEPEPEAAPPPSEEPVKTNPRKRPMRRGITQSRFTGFDDYEPPTKSRKIEEDVLMDDAHNSAPAQSSMAQSQHRSTQANQNDPSPVEESVQHTNNTDSLFPASTAIRRRRAQARGASQSVEPDMVEEQKPKSKGAQVLEQLQKAKKKVSKDIDVREQTRLHLQEEEKKRHDDEENLREQLEGVEISQLRHLAKVMTMDVEPRQNRPAQRAEDLGREWNDDWNGRKNFKKFRRRGAESGPVQQKVLVTLEEAPQKKGFGRGDAFFLEDTADAPRTKADERRLKRRGAHISDSEPESGFTRRKRNRASAKEAEPEVINVEDSGPDDEEEPVSTSTQRNRTQRVAETQVADTQTQTQRATRKRPPVTVAAGQPSSKRTRVARRNDDSDDEETGFRFRRRG
ncbi:hypothetical protein K491DRAFT_696326 [Lophiostoma macrostomum CBS 122681]|uniref:FHA domain-containing protein n=1 Tax=Lophiostoma macrostomum CBS 122681 TaxID=1314788 RepID=A0A6A6SVP0_9PLEO|nr:hypothetical protein K491DRAFT_696326 [Lophiostoma macrostomum CBS 122681]